MTGVVSLLFHDVHLGDPGESGFVSPAADRYKLSLDDFNAQLRGLTPDSTLPFLITVDDGGVSFYTVVADRLEAHGWRGHCFVSTDFIGTRGFLTASQIRELYARGHVIGTHTASHPARFNACSRDRMHDEWRRSRDVLEDVLGSAVTVGSVPGGYYSRAVARAASAAGLDALFTSEPTTSLAYEAGCSVVGRFTIRHGDDAGAAGRLVGEAPWARYASWARWNAKGLVKPLLGSSYGRVADAWLAIRQRNGRADRPFMSPTP